MRVLVTGGSGFIGSAVCRHLILDLGAAVLNVDKLTYAAAQGSLDAIANNPLYHFIRADVCDRSAMNAAFHGFRPTAVMHLAAESHVDRSIIGSAAFVETNIIGTHVLLEVARTYWSELPAPERGCFRFLHVSTDEVYGSLGLDGHFREDTAYDPSSPYAASKAAADHLVSAWHRTYDLPTLISNCSNNYGPYQFPEKLIPLTILNALEGQALPVYGSGSNIRDWLYVDDHARALSRILQAGRAGNTYAVGGRCERTNLAVVEHICNVMDRLRPSHAPHRDLIAFVADRPGHDLRYAIDSTKLESELGWRAREDFASGLEKTVRWYLGNADWWQPLRRAIYSGERLGLIASRADVSSEGAERVPAGADAA